MCYTTRSKEAFNTITSDMVVDRSQSLFYFVLQDTLTVKQIYVIYICYFCCIYYAIYMFIISIVYIDSDKRGSRPLKTQLMRLLRAKSTLGCSRELIMSQISFANIFVANILKKIFVFKNFICKKIGS